MIMLDHKPRYTVQLKLHGDSLEVMQIKDIGNRNLTDTEKAGVESALTTALNSRNDELSETLVES